VVLGVPGGFEEWGVEGQSRLKGGPNETGMRRWGREGKMEQENAQRRIKEGVVRNV